MITDKLFNEFQKLSDENQQRVLDFVELLINQQGKVLNNTSEESDLETLGSDQKEEKEIFWEEVLKIMKQQIIQPIFDKWIKSSIPLSLSETTFVIGAENDFIKEWLEVRYSDSFRRAVRLVIDRNVEIKFVVIEQHVRLVGR